MGLSTKPPLMGVRILTLLKYFRRGNNTEEQGHPVRVFKYKCSLHDQSSASTVISSGTSGTFSSLQRWAVCEFRGPANEKKCTFAQHRFDHLRFISHMNRP